MSRTYAEMAAHYDTAVLPARPRRPRDKAKVEAAVLIIERWLLGRLRHRRFYSLAELNATIGELLHQLNEERPIRRLGGTRSALLEELDRPHLKGLPSEPYAFAEWRLRRVGVDYHVEIEAHFYSVPYRFARREVEVRLTPRIVEVFLSGSLRICALPAITGTPPSPITCRRATDAMPIGRSSAFARKRPRSALQRHGRLMLTVLAGLAEFERDLIRVRTGEGRARAVARGQRMGRPFKLTDHQKREAIKRRNQGTLADIARSYNVSPATISRLAA